MPTCTGCFSLAERDAWIRAFTMGKDATAGNPKGAYAEEAPSSRTAPVPITVSPALTTFGQTDPAVPTRRNLFTPSITNSLTTIPRLGHPIPVLTAPTSIVVPPAFKTPMCMSWPRSEGNVRFLSNRSAIKSALRCEPGMKKNLPPGWRLTRSFFRAERCTTGMGCRFINEI